MDILNQVLLSEASNSDVISRFITKDYPKKGSLKSGNCRIEKESNGWVFINYSTAIAFIDDNHPNLLILNADRYSNTTSGIQSELRNTARRNNMEVYEGGEEIVREARYGGVTRKIFEDEDLTSLQRSCFPILFISRRKKNIEWYAFEAIRDKIAMIKRLRNI